MPEKSSLTSSLYRAADRGAHRSGLKAVAFLVVALVAAVGSALLLTRYMETRVAAARVPTEPVVVAEVELPVGSEIRAEHLRAVDWPVASRPEGALRDPAQLVGKVIASHVYRHEPILAARLAGAEGGGLSAMLAPGTRAVAVRVDDVVGVAGFVHPGDSVDVIATIRSDGGAPITSSKVILQNIKVLAVGKELDQRTKGPDKVVQATVATLQVDPSQSERLALAATQGKLLLTLRSSTDVELVATPGMTAGALLALPAPAAARPGPTRVAQAAPPPAARPEPSVEILRGELFERRSFDGGGKR
jgi:pilus assembly protein CpaB